jgi:CRP-like cAMP-binding protein
MTEKTVALTTKDLEWLDLALALDRFFAAFGPEGVQELVPTFALRAYSKGTEIVKEGETGSDLFILYKGSASVKQKKTLGSKELAKLQPGDFFGEIGFLEHKTRSASVVALEDTQAFSWPPADMEKVFEQNVGIKMRIEAIAKERMARLSGLT